MSTILPFKSSEAFIEYCNSNHYDGDVQKGQARPALVPQSGFMDIDSHVSKTGDGRYRASLLVAGPPGGFFTIAETPQPGGAPIFPGDLVVWMPFQKPGLFSSAKIGRLTGDKRSNWIGFIVAKIAPEIDLPSGSFTILSRYK